MLNKKAQLIKELRKKAGIPQAKLAKELGISRASYINIEQGKRDLTLEEAQKISSLFTVSLEEISIGQLDEQDVLPTTVITKNAKRGSRISVPQNNIAKFKQVLLYILEKVGSKANVGQTVLYKLLYFIDFDYYEKYEEQLMGAKYIKNTYGPTPVKFAKIVEQMKESGDLEEVKSSFFSKDQTKYLPRKKADLKILNGREIELIDDVLARLSDKTARDISEYSHEDIPWKAAKMGDEIKYETVFYRSDAYSVRQYEEL